MNTDAKFTLEQKEWGGGNCLMDTELQVEDEKVVEMYGGDGCATM